MSTERANFAECYGDGGQSVSLELIAEYEPDEENEARILMMILGLPSEEIERIVEEIRLASHSKM